MLWLGPGDGALSHWRRLRILFPVLSDCTRFNRRHLMLALNEMRRILLARLDLAADRQCVIDSLPVPVMHFHPVPSSRVTNRWKAHGATFGTVANNKQTIFGLAPANELDLVVGVELLTELVALGDKGYLSQPAATALRRWHGVWLLALPRTNQRDQFRAVVAALHGRWRQIIEMVNEQVADQLHIEENHATPSGARAPASMPSSPPILSASISSAYLGIPTHSTSRAWPSPSSTRP